MPSVPKRTCRPRARSGLNTGLRSLEGRGSPCPVRLSAGTHGLGQSGARIGARFGGARRAAPDADGDCCSPARSSNAWGETRRPPGAFEHLTGRPWPWGSHSGQSSRGDRRDRNPDRSLANRECVPAVGEVDGTSEGNLDHSLGLGVDTEQRSVTAGDPDGSFSGRDAAVFRAVAERDAPHVALGRGIDPPQ